MGTQQLNLFGDKVKIQAKKTKQETFEDYEAFLAKILRFYQATGIDYFLFAPGLTMFGNCPDGDCSVVVNTTIEYANKAKVLTGFHTSLFPGVKVMVAGTLSRKIAQAQKVPVAAMVRKYSDNVITSALLRKKAKGQDVLIYDDEVVIAKALDCGVDLFGGGVFNKRCSSCEDSGDSGDSGDCTVSA